jgi:hypothetical protein
MGTTIDPKPVRGSRKKKKPVKDTWEVAVYLDAISTAKLLRAALGELNFKFSRDKTEKPFTSLMVVVPMPRFAYAFQFKIEEPSEFVINIYDTKPTPSGILHLIEVRDINEDNLNDVRKVLKQLASKMPRKPWKFYWSERFKYALAAPEYVRAKKKWNRMGVI